MARSFNGTTDIIDAGTTDWCGTSDGNPWTIACWCYYSSSQVGTNPAFVIKGQYPNTYFAIFSNTGAGGVLNLLVGSGVADSGVSIPTDQWNFLVASAPTVGTAFGMVNSTSFNFTSNGWGINATAGAGATTFLGQVLTGNLAEVGIWNVSLTAAELAILSKGYSPLFVGPSALVAYWPIVGRTSPEINLVGGGNGTLTGTANAAHPRIIMPSRPMIGHNSAGAAPGGLDIPIAYHHYRTMHVA